MVACPRVWVLGVTWVDAGLSGLKLQFSKPRLCTKRWKGLLPISLPCSCGRPTLLICGFLQSRVAVHAMLVAYNIQVAAPVPRTKHWFCALQRHATSRVSV